MRANHIPQASILHAATGNMEDQGDKDASFLVRQQVLYFLESVLAGQFVVALYFLSIDKDVIQGSVWKWANLSTVVTIYIDENIPCPSNNLSTFFVGNLTGIGT